MEIYMNKKNKWFTINTVRKKVFLLSKLAGGILVLFYIVTSELPASRSISFSIWLLLLLIVIFGIDSLLERYISKPLNEINRTAEQMAKLDLTAYCQIQTKDEFGDLSINLNAMFTNLKETLEKLETANVQLEKDITQERILLAQRKELVDNLSHEMKTPLGIIRAYAEGVKDEPEDCKKEKYMDAILTAADHLNTMIVTLLDLSALEAGAAKILEERFDFIELVETVAGRLLIDTPNSNHCLTYELPQEKSYILADKYRIEQVLINLIENAKRHVCTGGTIHLSVIHQENRLKFAIFNQGHQIPVQEISKVWQKFYRGDHSKNEIYHGSGLGLSIVAQILSIYQSSYGAINLQNGVEFYFTFPTET